MSVRYQPIGEWEPGYGLVDLHSSVWGTKDPGLGFSFKCSQKLEREWEGRSKINIGLLRQHLSVTEIRATLILWFKLVS